MFETILRIMWEDVEERLKKFEDMTQSNLTWKNRLKNYYREVNLNFHLLDEGIGGSDADLASSLWSILTMKNQSKSLCFNLYKTFDVSYLHFCIFLNIHVFKYENLNS